MITQSNYSDNKVPHDSGWISSHFPSSQIQSLPCFGRLRSTFCDVSFILHICFCHCFTEEVKMNGKVLQRIG